MEGLWGRAGLGQRIMSNHITIHIYIYKRTGGEIISNHVTICILKRTGGKFIFTLLSLAIFTGYSSVGWGVECRF
jgi:hypothetical protein